MPRDSVSSKYRVETVTRSPCTWEGDAAFVYHTDLLGSEDVREVPLPADVEVRVQYGAVQVSEAPAAAEFMAWLTEPVATAVLTAAGFEVER